MSSKTINRKKTKTRADSTPSKIDSSSELKNVNIDLIDVSPLNYRKFFSQESLHSFAQELAVHGIISPLMLRPTDSGRYELIAGERRFRAAIIAQLKMVPAVIRALSDEEVIEVQLAENIQRENPHPMHEAVAIGQMQRTHKKIEEIADRLGKSKQFVYSRMKLLSLIEPFQEMFLSEVITIQQAVEIAGIAGESQHDFFIEACADWKTQKNFGIHNISYALRSYKYDLKDAPFNTKDKKLVPDAGACNTCPSNTATLKSLFPEYAKQAVCTNKECYHKKCTAHVVNQLLVMMEEHKPQALLFHGQLSTQMEQMLSLVPATQDLPKYDYCEVTILIPPKQPDKDDFSEDDEEEYEQAVKEYNAEHEAYQSEIEVGHYQKALLVSHGELEVVLFNPEKPAHFGYKNKSTANAKEVQAAIKTGTATTELLQAEIERIREREKRAQEIDRDKVQLEIYELFSEHTGNAGNINELTEADQAAARLIVYQSLGYSARSVVNAALFEADENEFEPDDNFLESLRRLTDQQYAYLIRMSVLGKPESKLTNHETGRCLYKITEAAGINIQTIEEKQQGKAAIRLERLLEKIAALEKKINKLKPVV